MNRTTENHLLTTGTSLIEWKDESPRKKPKTMNNDSHQDIYLLMATLRLLLFSNIKIELIYSWKWKQLIHLLNHSNNEYIKWFVKNFFQEYLFQFYLYAGYPICVYQLS